MDNQMIGTQCVQKPETPETKRMKENFAFFGTGSFLYALFYTFCMFRNPSGITFPFFIAATLFFFCFSLRKLGLTLKRGSGFYMISIGLLALSTMCTDDERIIFLNKLGILLLLMSFLLKQFYDVTDWKLGKYFEGMMCMIFGSLGELARPFQDGAAFVRKKECKHNATVLYGLLGLLIGLPVLLAVTALLSSADAVFRQVAQGVIQSLRLGNVFPICVRIAGMFLVVYLVIAFLCEKTLGGSVADLRKGEPVVAITITALLSFVYVLFSGIQIVYLFLGRMQLPEGYSYAEYAREGFFQLLAVSILNFVIVVVCMSFFQESRILQGILTVMSLCTFVMIASSALRMMIYIRFYYLTFLRILVLWTLAVLFLLFIGVIIGIYREKFPLFRYGVVVVTVLYLGLSFSHPDYFIAKVNLANTGEKAVESSFFLAEEPYSDMGYLRSLSADAAPVVVPYLEQHEEGTEDRYVKRMEKRIGTLGIRTYNVSRHIALKYLEELK